MKRSSIRAAVLQTATGLHRAGVMTRFTFRAFKRLCKPPDAPSKRRGLKGVV